MHGLPMRFLAIAGTVAILTPSFADVPSHAVVLHMRKLLLDAPLGDGGQKFYRWTTSPSVKIVGGSKEQREVVAQVIEELNVVLKPTTIQLRLVEGGNPQDAQILVAFSRQHEYADTARRLGIKYEPEALAQAWIAWDTHDELRRASVLLPNDLQYQEYLHHAALEELTHTLGLCGDSPLFEDSVLYQVLGVAHGSATTLSELDRKIIRFAYTHVHPGAGEDELLKAISDHWH